MRLQVSALAEPHGDVEASHTVDVTGAAKEICLDDGADASTFGGDLLHHIQRSVSVGSRFHVDLDLRSGNDATRIAISGIRVEADNRRVFEDEPLFVAGRQKFSIAEAVAEGETVAATLTSPEPTSSASASLIRASMWGESQSMETA